MRLLKESDVIKAVDKHTRDDGTLDDDISVILEEVETGFDKEKVIIELEGIGQKCNECNDIFGAEAMEYAAEIVEKGGIE